MQPINNSRDYMKLICNQLAAEKATAKTAGEKQCRILSLRTVKSV